MTTAGKAVPIGVYRGRGCGISKIEGYESFIGRTVSYVLDFMLEKPTTWAEFENGNLTSSVDVSMWQNQLGSRTLVLGAPACAGGSIGSGGSTWTGEANGVNDTHWTNLGNRLISLGLGNAVLRIGREFNGSWYQWQVTEGGQSAYISGYSHIVNLLRSLSGARFRFNWNPYIGVNNLSTRGTESCYPGDSVVDEVGLDVYDGDWSGIYPSSSSSTSSESAADAITTTMQQQVFDNMLTEWDSIRGWYNLAQSHGKALASPEWGLRLWRDSNVYHGGGDNAVLVNGMARFITGMTPPSGKQTWHAFWEDPWGAGVSDPDTLSGRPVKAPMARAAFLDWFGS